MDSTPAATNPTIYNVTLTNANTEYPQVLQDASSNVNPSLKKLMVRAQLDIYPIQYAFKTGGPYFDLLAGEIYWQDGLDVYGMTIYLKSAYAGVVVDIEAWN